MAVLTIEIPDKETKFVREFVKKIGGKIKKQTAERNKKSPYDPEFLAKIRKGDEDIEKGKSVKISVDDLWK